MEYLDEVLEVLGTAEYEPVDSFGLLAGELEPYLGSTSGMVFILNRWNESRRSTVRAVEEAGVPCHCILMSEEDGSETDSETGIELRVNPNTVLEGRCTEL